MTDGYDGLNVLKDSITHCMAVKIFFFFVAGTKACEFWASTCLGKNVLCKDIGIQRWSRMRTLLLYRSEGNTKDFFFQTNTYGTYARMPINVQPFPSCVGTEFGHVQKGRH